MGTLKEKVLKKDDHLKEEFTARYSDIHQFLKSKRQKEIPSIPDDSYLVKACEEGLASYYVIYNKSDEAITHFYYYHGNMENGMKKAELCLYRGLDTPTEKIMKLLLDKTPIMDAILQILAKEGFSIVYIEVINQKEVISFYTKYGFLIDQEWKKTKELPARVSMIKQI